MISLRSFYSINRCTKGLLRAGKLLWCMKIQMEGVVSPSMCSSKTFPGTTPPQHSSWLTCPTLMLFTAAKSYICISSTMGGEPRFLQSRLPQLTSLRYVSRPAYPVFPLTLLTCFQIMASLTPGPCQLLLDWPFTKLTSAQTLL